MLPSLFLFLFIFYFYVISLRLSFLLLFASDTWDPSLLCIFFVLLLDLVVYIQHVTPTNLPPANNSCFEPKIGTAEDVKQVQITPTIHRNLFLKKRKSKSLVALKNNKL